MHAFKIFVDPRAFGAMLLGACRRLEADHFIYVCMFNQLSYAKLFLSHFIFAALSVGKWSV